MGHQKSQKSVAGAPVSKCSSGTLFSCDHCVFTVAPHFQIGQSNQGLTITLDLTGQLNLNTSEPVIDF